MVIIPVARDQLIPGLLQGRGDIAMAGLTITADRAEKINFTEPATKPLSEILVTGPTAPALETIKDLAKKSMSVNPAATTKACLNSMRALSQKRCLRSLLNLHRKRWRTKTFSR